MLDKKSEEFARLQTYVKNTHAATHNQYDLVVEEVQIYIVIISSHILVGIDVLLAAHT